MAWRRIESKKKGMNSINDIVGDDLSQYLNMKPTSEEFAHKADRQVNKIYAILKWRFKWDKKHMYNYVMSVYPEVAKKLDDGERKHYNMTKVFLVLTKKEKGGLIKRIEFMEKRYKEMAKKMNVPLEQVVKYSTEKMELAHDEAPVVGVWEDIINV